ncbi:unnamed protein product [Kluyveromyces dobzhanskii CBS 2104]|uniref:Diacylglycerol O-acyltransferase n=1 Tax=Kluyveromyces dobzhanskii CBS 2104 TaxID=1427455 RepID=A0A0A8LAB7_9SACH|nr:unnamed protein product [Kluyveromyces dobzhanskii CBS 2104]
MSSDHIKQRSNKKSDKSIDRRVSDEVDVGRFSKDKKPEFCSINTPVDRRLQTLVVAWHTGSIVIMITISLFVLVNPFMWWFVIPYAIYYFTDRTASNGNVVKRYSNFFRSLPMWNYYRDYFPINLHRTTVLEPTFTRIDDQELETEASEPGYLDSSQPFSPSKWWNPFRERTETVKPTGPRYIFGYHPHGVAAFGVFGAFATEGCNWSKLFPGIPICLLTLLNQFQIPVYRDYLLALGITSVTRKNAMKVLEKNYSIAIVIGGASESLLSQVGSTDVILNKRKGFVKLALQTGNVNLVPVYAFGETDCYKIFELKDNTKLGRMQIWLKETFSFTIPLFFARGVFNYDFGLLPYRQPLDVVIGRPIYIKEKIEHPTIEQIDHYHVLYIKELRRIFDDNKAKFNHQEKTLNIVQ